MLAFLINYYFIIIIIYVQLQKLLLCLVLL